MPLLLTAAVLPPPQIPDEHLMQERIGEPRSTRTRGPKREACHIRYPFPMIGNLVGRFIKGLSMLILKKMGQAPGCGGPDDSMFLISVAFKVFKTTCKIIIPVQHSPTQNTSQANEHVLTSSSAADPCLRVQTTCPAALHH
jgi:hypothetical protein